MPKKISQLIKENFKSVLLVFCTLLLMVSISFQSASRIVNQQMQVIGEETLNTAEATVSGYLMETQITFANIAATVENMLLNGKDNEEILAYLENINQYYRSEKSPLPDFLKLYAYLQGEFLDGSGWIPPEEYVPQQRPWYTGAEHIDDIYFSEPYMDADTGDVCISFSKAMYNTGNQNIGVLAIDINISRITNYMRQLNFGNGSYGMVVNNSLQFVGHKHEQLAGLPLESVSEDYCALADSLKAGEAVSAKRFSDIDGTDSIVFFRHILNDWYLGLSIPRSSYYAPVYWLATALGVLGFVLASILSVLLLRTRYERMISIEESRSKSNFLSRMSHEMRTPMNAIIGMSNIARQSTDMQQIRYCSQQIDIAASHLLGIINDILDISKIESGKFTISETDFIFEKMLRRVHSVINHNLEEKSLNFNIILDPKIPYSLISDEQRLSQVITNLLSNAIKFTPEHGRVELKIDNMEDSGSDCLLQVQVSDTGIGIEPQQLEQLFQPFQQADNTISRRYGGTGLGLAISKSIIERLGGTIWAESTPGEGSRFYFTVKVQYGANKQMLHSAEPQGAEEQADDYSNIFSGRTILMAEDVEINAEILICLLDETGVHIEWVQNGQLAFEAFEAEPNRFDLILMDIHMPELDGHEATRKIRTSSDPRGAVIPIIAMTANVFQEDIDYCLQVGMNDHVGKPLDIDEVIAKLKRYL